MHKINVKIPERKEYTYPIIIGTNILENAQEYINNSTKAQKFLIVTNETVYPLINDRFKLGNSNYAILPDGEEYKTLESINFIIDKAIEHKLDRTCAIVALGGGVIGDMAGFAAAIYQRGIDYIQIPTTLLAQVDSSVGGKVAVNHKEGKNLIGNFYQPKLVLADISTLNTLDERQFKTGLSEVLKYSFIENSCESDKKYNFFDFLEENRENILKKEPTVLEKVISICYELKSCVVNKDEKENGLRAILNFGHTYAHAIEKITDYTKYTHGEAVSIGMNYIFELGVKMGLTDLIYAQKCINLMKNFGLMLNYDAKISNEKLYSAMTLDKKVRQGKIRFVIPIKGYKAAIKENIPL